MRHAIFALALLAAAVSAARAGEALWAEGEQWTEQRGSVGPDRPPFGSRGACLGSHWAGKRNDSVLYRFRLAKAMPDARLHVRYARGEPGDPAFALSLDGRVVEERAVFKNTGGWGHLRDDEWAFRAFALGRLDGGTHELRLVSLADKNNANIDGFFLASGAFQPPNTRAGIERVRRLGVESPGRWRPVPSTAALVDPDVRIEDFEPMGKDIYYPAEEARERAALEVPRVIAIEKGRVVLADANGQRKALDVGQAAFGWELAGITTAAAKPAAVLERHFRHWGLIAYVNAGGTVATIRKAVGQPRHIPRPTVKVPPKLVDALLKSRADILGDKVLRRKSDPSFEGCAGFLPDVAGYTFLSTVDSPAVIAVETEVLGPEAAGPRALRSPRASSGARGIGGHARHPGRAPAGR